MHKSFYLPALLLIYPFLGTAQTPLVTALQRAVFPKTTLTVLSQQANRAAYKNIAAVLRPLPPGLAQKPQPHFTPTQRRQVFQVQRGPLSSSSASAFALEIDGRVWGITAAHVMKNISLSPHMVVQNERGKPLVAPITFHHTANTNGSDLAIFEIPKKLLPYVEVLHAQVALPAPQTLTQSPCFVKGNPLYLPAEDVLFAGPHRILLRDQAHREMTGYCGSPVLADGKVIGVHVAAYTAQAVQLASWNSLIGNVSTQTPPPLHVATPIAQAVLLARDFTQNTAEQSGILLQVFGRPVAMLTPHEQLYSVQHLRHGLLKNQLRLHPFIQFDKLEEFFDLQEGDVLRITVLSPKTIAQATAIKIYEVDVSTGQVTTNL